MNIHARLRNKAISPPASSQVHGQWFNIRFTPDLATGERLNIGVGLIDMHGGVQTRMLSNFERLRCLYDGRVDLDDLHFLTETLDAYWRHEGLPSTSPVANISFSALKYASGSSVAEILEDLYRETVTLEPTPVVAKRKAEVQETITDEKARELVRAAMGRKTLLADRLWPDDARWQIEPGKTLDMPLRDERRFGTLISAWYKQASTLELHTLKAYADLETAAKVSRTNQGGLFIWRPPEDARGYPDEQQRQIDNIIDNIGWRLKKDRRLRLEVQDSPSALSDRILEWADMAA